MVLKAPSTELKQKYHNTFPEISENSICHRKLLVLDVQVTYHVQTLLAMFSETPNFPQNPRRGKFGCFMFCYLNRSILITGGCYYTQNDR